jgi:Domain of unknown function (DUF1924)
MRLSRLWPLTGWHLLMVLMALVASTGVVHAQDTSPQALLQQYAQEAGSPGQATRGQAFFLAKHGQRWRCASCHQANPLTQGQHAATGKTIAPLAPAANAERFTRVAKAEKWFKRNCNDVLQRACTPQEKADVLAWLTGLRP